MNDIKLIQAVPVERDENGQWWHPDMPEFDESEHEDGVCWFWVRRVESASVR